MLDEGSGAMEKKLPPRQSPAQPKNNGVVSEKKSDYISNKNGRQRKYKQPNNGGRSQELSQNAKPFQKYGQSFSDKRPRQRGYYNDRQSEEIVEAALFVGDDDTSSRKGNANYLLRFSFTPRGGGEFGRSPGGRFGRSGNWTRRTGLAPRYSPEQFLQASCQFIVKEGGGYTEQTINPDALVNWDLVEQVRTFSVEPAICPICLQRPSAGKITKCGHVYCWSCILHHLQEKELMCRKLECPICPHRIDPEELRSVLCVETKDYKVGNEIEMKLMRKNKGSVYVSPKSEWTDREGIPHNIDDGPITQYMKLLSATSDQIQEYIIDQEKRDLDELLLGAEEYETSYIHMAKDFLQKREENLKMKIRVQSLTDLVAERKLSDHGSLIPEPEVAALVNPTFKEETEATIRYADAFEEKEEEGLPPSLECGAGNLPEVLYAKPPLPENVPDMSQTETLLATEVSPQGSFEDSVSSCPNSPARTLPLMNQPFSMTGHLTPEEAADHLELPEGGSSSSSQQRNCGRNKDVYYFYQASSGQHIYLNSLNAQCLTREYGSLEHSPEVITAKIVAIERIFMSEDVRKRLRYLSHIPLTCEFHVVELQFQPPLVSRETLQHFQPEFDKRRRARQRKKREEKERAKQQEVEHKASFGIYPEVQIPLDNLIQFPASLGSVSNVSSSQVVVGGSTRADSISESSSESLALSLDGCSPRQRNDSEGSQTGLSFAQMLKSGKSAPQGSIWGRVATKESAGQTLPAMMDVKSPPGRQAACADDDDGGEYLPAPPIATSWFDDISKAMNANSVKHQAQGAASGVDAAADAGGQKKKKKKKEKQLLFSTSMARKG